MINAALELGWELIQLSTYAIYFAGLATVFLVCFFLLKATFKKINPKRFV
jgi:hypothetical protein